PVETVDAGRWIGRRSGSNTGSDADSVLLEPVDLPDAPGTLLVHVPRLSWIYTYGAGQPLDLAILRDRIRERGWDVERIGSARGLRQPFGTGSGQTAGR
ncbi:MAG: hypothetical protein ACODAA_02220, partial [Gemmatimonadota bacterium]